LEKNIKNSRSASQRWLVVSARHLPRPHLPHVVLPQPVGEERKGSALRRRAAPSPLLRPRRRLGTEEEGRRKLGYAQIELDDSPAHGEDFALTRSRTNSTRPPSHLSSPCPARFADCGAPYPTVGGSKSRRPSELSCPLRSSARSARTTEGARPRRREIVPGLPRTVSWSTTATLDLSGTAMRVP
jgi:hypothetical protein